MQEKEFRSLSNIQLSFGVTQEDERKYVHSYILSERKYLKKVGSFLKKITVLLYLYFFVKEISFYCDNLHLYISLLGQI